MSKVRSCVVVAFAAALAACAGSSSNTDGSARSDISSEARPGDGSISSDALDGDTTSGIDSDLLDGAGLDDAASTDAVEFDRVAVDVARSDATPGDVVLSDTSVDAPPVETDECVGRPMACPTLTAGAYPVGSGLRAIERCAYGLVDSGERPVRLAVVADLEARLPRRSLTDVIANLNRSGTRVTSMAGMPSFRRGFRWNAGDDGVTYWYPQGLTSSADAFSSGRLAGRFVMIASWYFNGSNAPPGEPVRGTRLAVVDATNLDAVDYRLVLLVRPIRLADGTPSFEPLLSSSGTDGLHAGGIVWWDHFLYVADTGGGYRVFDLNHVLEVPTDDDRRIGYSATARAYGAFNYRYALPEIGRYRDAPGSCASLTYSFVGLDRSTTLPTLVSGEYVDGSPIGRLVRYRIDTATGGLYTRARVARPTEAWVSAENNMQGAFSRGATWWLSSSGAMRALHRTRVGAASADYAWPYGCEDLTYDSTTGLLWTLTEHPDQRFVVAGALADLGG